MPLEIKNNFSLFDFDANKLKTHHPQELHALFEKTQSSFLEYAEQYPWHILGLLSHFKLQINSTLEDFESNKPSSINFNNPLISESLVKLKTHTIYPRNPDIYIDFKIKTPLELQLSLTSIQIQNEEDNNYLIFKSGEKEIVHLHSSVTMNHFIKFILQNAIGIKIADLLVNLKVPSIIDLEAVTSNLEQIKASKSLLLNGTEELILKLIRTQISK